MHPDDPLVRDAAIALLAGDWTGDGMTNRLVQLFSLSTRQKWIETLVAKLLAHFGPHPPTPRQPILAGFLANEPGFCRAIGRLKSQFEKLAPPESIDSPGLTDVLGLPFPGMNPDPAIRGTDRLPPLVTSGVLADWLGVSLGQLDWFADCHGRERSLPAGKLRHYRYRWMAKSGGRQRLVECPKPRLKQFQRQILNQVLTPITAHSAAHAFQSGRSTLSGADPHVGQRVVLRIDLCDFFPTIRSSRIHGLFHSLGYPDRIAQLLTGLCTNSVPEDVFPEQGGDGRRYFLRQLFGQPHLPQGAPTSPALANLCAFRLDCRLAGLARTVGARYTRYADDLVFSGDHDFERSLPRFRIFACAIVLAEGFAIRHRKTRVMRSGARQTVTGLVVNRRINVDRTTYDHLKAILHNCRREGPASQNRERHPRFREHLQGRIASLRMVHPERGDRLQREFDAIVWPESDRAGEMMQFD
ncbi:MAG: reverse transcriptase family protein [Planctomycetales bacterium]